MVVISKWKAARTADLKEHTKGSLTAPCPPLHIRHLGYMTAASEQHYPEAQVLAANIHTDPPSLPEQEPFDIALTEDFEQSTPVQKSQTPVLCTSFFPFPLAKQSLCAIDDRISGASTVTARGIYYSFVFLCCSPRPSPAVSREDRKKPTKTQSAPARLQPASKPSLVTSIPEPHSLREIHNPSIQATVSDARNLDAKKDTKATVIEEEESSAINISGTANPSAHSDSVRSVCDQTIPATESLVVPGPTELQSDMKRLREEEEEEKKEEQQQPDSEPICDQITGATETVVVLEPTEPESEMRFPRDEEEKQSPDNEPIKDSCQKSLDCSSNTTTLDPMEPEAVSPLLHLDSATDMQDVSGIQETGSTPSNNHEVSNDTPVEQTGQKIESHVLLPKPTTNRSTPPTRRSSKLPIRKSTSTPSKKQDDKANGIAVAGKTGSELRAAEDQMLQSHQAESGKSPVKLKSSAIQPKAQESSRTRSINGGRASPVPKSKSSLTPTVPPSTPIKKAARILPRAESGPRPVREADVRMSTSTTAKSDAKAVHKASEAKRGDDDDDEEDAPRPPPLSRTEKKRREALRAQQIKQWRAREQKEERDARSETRRKMLAAASSRQQQRRLSDETLDSAAEQTTPSPPKKGVKFNLKRNKIHDI